MTENDRRFEKAVRYYRACKTLDGLAVPALLERLKESGALGAELAEMCWDVITGAIAQNTGKPETRPDTSLEFLLKLCEADDARV